MKKKTVKKKKAKDLKTVSKPTTEGNEIPSNENESPLDFGGLPERDLKKNLGCG